ncbi:MAG: YncE family protein, partial [Chitinophagales bacterium]|nr:YncE family protein [Hyphomicrobiales bacterium]
MRALFTALLFTSAAHSDEAFIVNQISEDVSVVDLEAGKVVATIPIGGKPAGIAV